jgi:hypothetical protein
LGDEAVKPQPDAACLLGGATAAPYKIKLMVRCTLVRTRRRGGAELADR